VARIISIISRNTMPGRKRVRATDPDIFMIRVDEEPGAGSGTEAPVGSFAIYEPPIGIEIYYKFGPLDTEWRLFLDKDGILAAAGADERVKVTLNDSASGFLLDKISTTTSALSLTEVNDGGNEDLEINVADASEVLKGLIEIATQAEVNAGSSTTLAVTPAYLSNTTLTFDPKSHAPTHLSTGSDPIDEMVGATAGTDGLDGLVTKPLTGEQDKYLKGDGTWSVISGISLETTIVEVTGTAYTVLSGDDIVLVNQTADAVVTVTLPAGASHDTGLITIKDKKGTAATRTLTIAADGAETIDGQSTHEITVNYRARQLVFFGTEWSIV
jgi:hypothetical protein